MPNMNNQITLKGIGVSKGIAIGPIKVVTEISEVNKVKTGDIVVTNNNSPLYSRAFLKAAAIISERGGMLCHLAIVAREFDKPCILDVKNATKLLKNTMTVEVNGSNGEIYVK